MRNHRLRRALASDIVTGGLVFHLDASNRDSYPGSGTTWFDVSGNGRNFTLVNGPTFSTSNGGYFTFDGSNDHATLPYDSGLNLTSWTVSVWVYLTSNPSNLDTIIARDYPSTINYYIDCRTGFQTGSFADPGGGNNDISVQSTTSCSSSVNLWRNVVGTFNGSTMVVYINGVSETSASKTWSGATSTTGLTIGALMVSGSPARLTDMRLGHASLYSRPLSANEVLSNFNSLRGRYGV